MRGKSAVVAFDHDPSAGTERLRPPGEDAPVWLAPVLALVGTLAMIWAVAREPEPPPAADLPVPSARSDPASAPATSPTTNMVAPTAPSATTIVSSPPQPASSGPVTASDPAARSTTDQPVAPEITPAATSDDRPNAPTQIPAISPPIPAATSDLGAPRPTPPTPTPDVPATTTEADTVAVAGSPAPAVVPAASQPVVVAPTAPCLPIVTVSFAHDSTKPILEGREAAVRPLVDWIAAHPGAVLSVEGHADTVGTEDYNIVLSFGRARAVAGWLGRLGVPAARIAPRAAGTTPAKGLPADVSTNRLVVLQIEGVDVCRDTGGATKRP